MNKFQVIATLNRHLLAPEILNDLVNHGATIFRLNGAHVGPAELEHYGKAIRNAVGSRVRILLDLPGNKIRIAALPQPIPISREKTFELNRDQINFPSFLEQLRPGDVLLGNDSLFKFTVESVSPKVAILRSHSDGLLGSNKGIHLIVRSLPLPFLFEKDHALIQGAKAHGFDCIGLSFVRTPEDVMEGKKAIAGSSLTMIVKVETRAALDNLTKILEQAEEFLVDRGDLSCDVGVEHVDEFQKRVLAAGKKLNKRIYFATQFLHSMVENNVPLIAEACGLADAIRCGVDGVQLSEEISVGRHPLGVLDAVQAALRVSQRPGLQSKQKPDGPSTAPVYWLTGRSGSGKTTLARPLIEALTRRGFKCCLIDGDDYREFWDNDTGYTKEDRLRNLRTIIFTAYQASLAFDAVVVASLSPYREVRELARKKIANFHEIHIHCSLKTCKARDPKGHYRKAAAGQLENFTGVSEEYEEPTHPELVVETGDKSVADSFETLQAYVFPQAGSRA